MHNDKRLRFTAPHDRLPALGRAVTDDAGAKPLTDAVVNDGGCLGVKCRAFVHNCPLRCREGVRLTGEAEPPQKPAADLIVQLLQRLPRLDHRPDLALARQDHTVHIGGDDGNFVTLVRIGKACHAAKLQKAVAEPMPARCTKLQYQIRQLATDAGKECLRGCDLLAQPLAQRFRTVTAETDILVVIDFHIVNIVVTQEINDLVRQILLHLGLAHIPKAAVARCDGPPIAGQQPLGFVEAVRLIPPDHLKLKPDAGFHTGIVDRIHDIL